MNAIWLVTISNPPKKINAHCFNRISISATVESTMVLPSVELNSLNQWNTTQNVQGLHWCSCYSHKMVHKEMNKTGDISF
jgi:hypothetical protein